MFKKVGLKRMGRSRKKGSSTKSRQEGLTERSLKFALKKFAERQIDLKTKEKGYEEPTFQGCQSLYFSLKISTQILFSEFKITKIFLVMSTCLTSLRFLTRSPPSDLEMVVVIQPTE